MATVQGLYLALFGRPADPLGLAYFNTQTNNGADLSKIGDLASTPEYSDRFTGMNNTQIVASIYQSLFGRAPDLAGLTFFSNQLASGAQSINTIAINILDGARGDDLTTVNNKLTAANLFTSHLDTGAEVVAYSGDAAAAQGREFLSGITSDTASIPTAAQTDAAIADVGTGGGIEGSTFTLTAANFGVSGVDNITGTANDDTIRAVPGSLDSNDVIHGGAGVDTLNILAGGIAANAAPVIDGVEFIHNAGGNLDLTDVSGVTTLYSSADAAYSNADLATTFGVEGTSDVTVTLGSVSTDLTGDASSIKLDAHLTTDAGAVVAPDATFDITAGGAAIEHASINLEAGNTGSVTIEGTEAVAAAPAIAAHDINGDGDTLDPGEGAVAAVPAAAATNFSGLTEVDVTGAGKGTVTVSDAAHLVTFDASANTGGVTATFNNTATELTAIKGGAGADSFTVDTHAGLTVSLGAGNDTIAFTFGGAIDQSGGALTDADVTKALVTVSDFSVTNDTLNLSGATLHTVVNNEQTAIDAATTLLAAATAASANLAGAEDTVAFNWHGSAYIAHDTDGSNGFSNGDDIIHLTGVSASDLSASNLVVA